VGVALDISVIIPSNHELHDLLKVLQFVCCQTVKPAEVVIVNSSVEGAICPKEIRVLCAINSIKLIYEHLERALPGGARNIGLNLATCEIIAFIDVQTIPRSHWLETSLNLLSDHADGCILGLTCFKADTMFERLVRDGFYGVLPCETLPGSVCRREVFAKAGQFIDWVRAGEDTDWMLRLKVLRIPVLHSPCPLVDYSGLMGLDMKRLQRKWYRNYTASRDLPHFFPQKLFLWLVFYPMLVLIAFNWNYLVADWRIDSPLYISHVTKIVAILPVLIYVFLRGLVLPLKRGVSIWSLLPVRFLAITLVCLLADLVKVMVFSFPNPIQKGSKSRQRI
jgi:hypothetical protein